MIIVTGDLHGDWGRLNALIASKHPEIILQCGDFGWWPQLEVKKPVLYGMQKKWTHKGLKTGVSSVYFCDGNHEQEMTGIHEPTGTEWRCLDYPGHGGRWWVQI